MITLQQAQGTPIAIKGTRPQGNNTIIPRVVDGDCNIGTTNRFCILGGIDGYCINKGIGEEHKTIIEVHTDCDLGDTLTNIGVNNTRPNLVK